MADQPPSQDRKPSTKQLASTGIPPNPTAPPYGYRTIEGSSALFSPEEAHFLAYAHLNAFSDRPFNNPYIPEDADPLPRIYGELPCYSEDRRREVYADTYTPDVVVHHANENVAHGHAGIDELVEDLIGTDAHKTAGCVFAILDDDAMRLTNDTIHVSWGCGQPPKLDDVKAYESPEQATLVQFTGSDVLRVKRCEDGKARIQKVYVVTEGVFLYEKEHDGPDAKWAEAKDREYDGGVAENGDS